MELKFIDNGVCAPKGFKAAGIHCGIRRNQAKKDIMLLVSEKLCTAAAVYTTNKVYGAPITVTRANIADGHAIAAVCNSGNANTCNADGVEKAQAMCDLVAKAAGVSASDVIVASTGVIGLPLNLEPIAAGIPALAAALSYSGAHDAAEAIMTTDTKAKEVAVEFTVGGKPVRIAAMAKGSGMIHPNMATMLCFVTSDAAIEPDALQKALKAAVDVTFNMVSVDGDTSTNDMVSIMANGMAENPVITEDGEGYADFAEALRALLEIQAKRIAGDGEGATKLLECRVTGAPCTPTARKVAKSVINSSLFKAAMFGADANWGRVLCAVGYTDAQFGADTISVELSSEKGSVLVCKNSSGVDFSEELAKQILLMPEVCITIDMGQGDAEATAWGCDLTYDYVKINGDYRS